ncbi:hypothetical protein [Arthrobacter sp. JSM 101049]|uniref:hypothetical protein n=1 Tax=Arthrobacter sp. JSM 101049 TaxID=929097 RepID=UPI003561AA37
MTLEHRRTRPWITTTVLAVALLLTGCSSAGQDPAETPQPGGSAASEAGATGSDAGAAQTTDSITTAAPAADLGNLGERPGGDDKDTVITLNSVSADAGTMTVNFSLTNNKEKGNVQVSDLFANGINETDEEAGGNDVRQADAFSVDGVYVITPEKKRYLVGRGENQVCACSSSLAGTFVNEGQTMTFSAVFAAPPADVKSVDVHIPTAGAFENVALVRR